MSCLYSDCGTKAKKIAEDITSRYGNKVAFCSFLNNA